MIRSSIVSLLAVAALAGAGAAAAAPGECGPRPVTPTVPDGATAQIEDMKAASSAIETFADKMDAYANCLIDAAQSAIDTRNEFVERWNDEIATFNGRLTK